MKATNILIYLNEIKKTAEVAELEIKKHDNTFNTKFCIKTQFN